jgi:hypothetical protein
MNWGYGVAALYGGFVLFTLAIVGYASFQQFDLVDKDYYARGLDHDRHMARINRVAALPEKPRYEFSRETGEIILHFPQTFKSSEGTGEIVIFRPSSAELDITAPIKLSTDMTQCIRDKRLVSGMWRVKLSWTARDLEYYHEQELWLE